MKTLYHFNTSIGDAKVDDESATIYGAALVSEGKARGHDLDVIKQSLEEMMACAVAKGELPVRIDHKSGAGSLIGFVRNFRIRARKLLGDLFLLRSHPQTPQVLETAIRAPRIFGLSAEFLTRDDAPPGIATCKEIMAFALVPAAAANPDGLFSAKDDPPRRSVLNKGARILVGAGLGGLLGRAGSRTAAMRINARLGRTDQSPAVAAKVGTVAGALAGGALVARHDAQEAKRRQFERGRPAIRRIEDATKANLPTPEIPYVEEAASAGRFAKRNPRLVTRAGKILVGAGLGGLAARMIHRKLTGTGAIIGGTAGALLFEQSNVMKNQLPLSDAEQEKFVDDAFETMPLPGNRLSQSPDDLRKTLFASNDDEVSTVLATVLPTDGELYRDPRSSSNRAMAFKGADLNHARRELMLARVQDVLERLPPNIDPAAARRAVTHLIGQQMLRSKQTVELSAKTTTVTSFAWPYRRDDEDQDGVLVGGAKTAGKLAVAGGLAYGGAAYARGRGLAGPGKGLLPTLKVGAIANNKTLRRAAIGGSRGLDKILAALGNRKI